MKKIIIIDDTIHLLEEIKDLLVMEGYHVTTAFDASDGMAKIMTIEPDLIITDILMPEIDGLTLISNIRSISEFRKIPIIVLSAGTAKENEEQAKVLKVNQYLRKPCAADELLLAIEKVFN